MLKFAFEDFFHYLQIERGLSENTLKSYRSDLNQYCDYIDKVVQKQDWKTVNRSDIIGFLHLLKDDGKSSATSSRTNSCSRSFHQFLIRDTLADEDASLYV